MGGENNTETYACRFRAEEGELKLIAMRQAC